ncbi:RagB/SusD family nutrient uptake outer membrane protein [Rudanella paleaurantiibacter]|uniref:RagB/SusD family nutrient uptake outer membrane protein n=1 Tax=Rudanella paleaurantiibacter TaxID=2614655 RepID=A0A7J5TXH3_9BACT|nr:RagB/SusD family nutrient uptake outer membrane protein [Rudanella paleaurantiibacter]KAB7729349.1 RagB/SusD family nutrient uptake outer membrane protein [Rudanella paleaurantiibacter]
MKTSNLTLVIAATLAFTAVGCTDLEDKVIGQPVDVTQRPGAQVDLTSLLSGVYGQLNGLTDQANTYAMGEHSSDEMMGPTRGTDWDDFGTWRRLHQHTWDATHNQIVATWNQLNTGVFRATELIAAAQSNPSVLAQGRFLRAFFMYHIVDLYGQVPFREANASFDTNPRVLSRAEATQFIIDDLTAAIPGLPTTANASQTTATRAAGQFLMAKVMLNKAVFVQNPQQPQGPFTFAQGDMNAVIANCDAIINSGTFALEPSGQYFDNFHWDNSTLSRELVFALRNDKGAAPANARNRFYMTLHYNQTPSGWNGFTTLADFYNSFEANDQRRGATIPGMTDVIGLRAGFLAGQQTNGAGRPLTDRGGAPLTFTPDVNLLYANERMGIRVVKYFPDPTDIDNSGNDYVMFRYADVLLMKAEAILRGGTATGGATVASLVNQVRTARGASNLTSVNEAALLAERGRELYWEGWRRNDMVRFGTFLNPFDQKPTPTPPHRVVYPIPQQAIDTNPNLKQNFGY